MNDPIGLNHALHLVHIREKLRYRLRLIEFNNIHDWGLKLNKLPLFLLLLLIGCATPEVVSVKKASDVDLPCSALKEQLEEAKNFEKKAAEERTVTGGNVARTIFFWPALVGTYVNAGDAIAAARSRQEHLVGLINSKDCK